jgi:hypothetical protein
MLSPSVINSGREAERDALCGRINRLVRLPKSLRLNGVLVGPPDTCRNKIKGQLSARRLISIRKGRVTAHQYSSRWG